ncbi:MAG TPA: S49 family peptidase, partial [Phycisphaerae bacterium]|nr:S49 family peptidase [Phycisphaerae bacterium]
MGTLISKKHQIRRVVATAYEAPWAITRDKLDAIVDLLDRRSQGHLDEKEIEARLAGFQAQSRYDDDDEDDRPYRLVGGVAVIPLYGVLMPRGNLVTRMSGGMSTQEFTAAVQAALDDDDVRRIVLDVDSPGGSVLGIEEAAELVRAVNDRKPVVTAATNQMASAAYWIGAAAGEVVASPSTQVGCIGVFCVHSDYSAADTTAGIKRTVIFAGPNKTLGNPHETLSQDGRDGLRQESNDYYEAMLAGLARYRGLSIEALQQRLGQRNTLRAPDAREAGLIDRVATLSEVVAGLADKPSTQASTTGFSQQENAMDPRIMQA